MIKKNWHDRAKGWVIAIQHWYNTRPTPMAYRLGYKKIIAAGGNI